MRGDAASGRARDRVSDEDHAHAPVLPPVVFAAAVAAALALKALVPVPFVPRAVADRAEVAGVAMSVAGGMLAAWALATFLWERTTPLPNRPARALVTGGPYRLSRNPMYIGISVVLVGLSLVANDVWMLAVLPPVWLLLTRFVIRPEEAYLERKFGEEYRAFLARTRRWL